MTSKTKNLIIFIIAIIGLALVYVFVIKKEPDQAPLVSVVNPLVSTDLQSDTSSSLTQDFLTILLNVKNIKLDDTIFNDPAFLSLSDSSILLTLDNTEGRSNPFAPLGSDSQAPVPPVSGTTPLTPGSGSGTGTQ